MKAALVSMMGLGAGGAAYFGMHDAPDFDRIVNRPPIEVYAAFSTLAQEGTISPPNQAPGRRVTFKVAKVRGESISYEIQFDDRPVVEAELTFTPAGADGQQTRLTAELDLDEYELGSGFETEAGIALSMVSERIVDRQFANFMEDMVRDVEARRPLAPLGLNRARVRQARASADVSVRRANAAAAQCAAVRPMVDPNRAAAAYRNGTPNPGGGWGR